MTRPHEIQPGTVLNYAANDVPSQLPWNCVSEGWLTGNIYEGLLYMYMNDPQDIRGCIAERWEHSEDYLTWTFHIRDGVTFHDGTVCDAYAVAKAWDYIDERGPAFITNYNISSWEARSETEFTVHLSAPCAYFETSLCGGYLLIVSPSALALYGLDDNKAAVGTGPYYIASYEPGQSIVLKANHHYYLEEKTPCIETVNFKVVGVREDVLNALINGEIDGANIGSLELNYFINSHYVNSYQYLLEKGYGGNLIEKIVGSNPLWLNAKKVEAFRTREVREAVCRFIDFEAINGALYGGLGCVQDSLWVKGSSGYVPSDQFYYDPEEGQELLASVGIAPSDIKGEVFYADSNKDILLAVQSELIKAGVQIDMEGIHPEWSFTPAHSGDWAIYFFGTIGYGSAAPYGPWKYILKPDALIKTCFQDVYDPDLYQKMLDEYDAMFACTTWGDMLTHSRQLTAYVQDDFGAIAGVQPPSCIALSKDFKSGVYFSESLSLQLYYLYQ